MKRLILFILISFAQYANGQNNRISSYNQIGWYNYFGTFKLTEKIGLHTEYQGRRTDFITDWQQSLLRVGLNYNLNAQIQFRIGYAWVESFNYGDIPINGFGKDYTEHRIFEMLQLNNKLNRFEFSHRFILEQRFVGKYSDATKTQEDEFPFLNRIRYMFRFQVPLRGHEIVNKTPYLAFYDELFIGFGENVNANVFDQNRIGIILGYKFNPTTKIEAGYLNQTLQFGRLVNSKNVFQYNNGFIVNALFNFDLSRKN